jgi:MFS-type transporter involved in bile tolerance (Atg22 family)
VAFTVVMGGVAGPRRRFYVMSLRWSSLGAVTAITVTLVGQALDRIAFPLNYQLIFMGSFLGGLLSFFFSRSILLPDNQPEPDSAPAPAHRVDAWLRSLVDTMRSAPPTFRSYALSAFVFRCGVAMALPLFPLYWVREVAASDAWIGIISTAGSAVLLVAYFVWSVAARKIGIGAVLLISSFGMSLYPLAATATSSVLLLAVFAGLGGFFSAGNDLVNFDLVLSTAPAEHQATYVGLFQTLQNAALFMMPLLGTALADLAGLHLALVVAGVLRLIGTGLYIALGVGRSPAAEAATTLK